MLGASRELLVGLLMIVLVTLVGCQPVQPVTATPDDTSAPEMATAAITQTGAMTSTATTPVTASATVTVTNVVTDVIDNGDASVAEVIDPDLLAAGLAAYRAQYCGVCHLLDAAGTRGTFGPTHNGLAATAAAHLAGATYTGAATTPAEYILESIVDPQAFIVPGYATTSHRMPPYAHLDAATLEALVAFLLAH